MGRIVKRMCEHWLQSRRQCRRPATVQVDESPPRFFCTEHARVYLAWAAS